VFLEFTLAGKFAADVILELALPVPAHGILNVAFVIGVGVDIYLNQKNFGVYHFPGDPFSGHQDPGVPVIAHRFSNLLVLKA
jgi:hypothetical protein